MKIIDAKLQVVEVPLPHPFPSTWNPGNPETKLFVTIAEIITDDGIHGYGAACDSSQLLAGIWDTHIRPLVIGKEITQVEAINTGLVNASLYAYRPWCVEVAVWDALGKYANLPIYKMLGGVQDKVLAYASTGSLKSVEERVEDAERYIAEGFKMMKLRAHHDDPFEDVRIIAEIKKRVGDKLKIAVDANQGWFFTGKRSVAKWDLKKALNVCRAFEEIGIEWIEEPLYGYDFEGLAELRKRTTLHVAGGELNAQVHEYRDLIKHNCFDIYQMDVVLSGGFVQNRKVAAMAEAENKIYTPVFGPIHPNGVRIFAPVGMYPDVVRKQEPGTVIGFVIERGVLALLGGRENRLRIDRPRAPQVAGTGDADRTAQFTFLVKSRGSEKHLVLAVLLHHIARTGRIAVISAGLVGERNDVVTFAPRAGRMIGLGRQGHIRSGRDAVGSGGTKLGAHV